MPAAIFNALEQLIESWNYLIIEGLVEGHGESSWSDAFFVWYLYNNSLSILCGNLVYLKLLSDGLNFGNVHFFRKLSISVEFQTYLCKDMQLSLL